MEVRESKKRKKKKRMEFRLRPEGFLSMTEKKKNQYTSEDPPPPFSSLSSLVIQFRLHPAFGPPPPYHPSSTSAISFFPDDSGDPFLFFFLLETKKKTWSFNYTGCWIQNKKQKELAAFHLTRISCYHGREDNFSIDYELDNHIQQPLRHIHHTSSSHCFV